jgi:hypothetical protein
MALSGFVINGGRKAEFFTITVGTTQTTFASTTPVYTCVSQITSDGANDDNGIRTWTIDQVQADKLYWDFVQTYAPASTTSATTEELTMENGEIISGASAGSTELAMLVRGATIKDGPSNGKRLAWAGLVKVSKSSGSVNFAGTAYVKPTLTAIATSITTNLVVPSGVLADYVGSTAVTPVTVTIAASTYPYGKMLVDLDIV